MKFVIEMMYCFFTERHVADGWPSNRKDLEFIVKLALDGAIRPVIDRRYSLDQTVDAMRYAGKGHARGKVVIKLE
jgi:NADPH:quinone reductase-like Zn-dependent oxidoreductase